LVAKKCYEKYLHQHLLQKLVKNHNKRISARRDVIQPGNVERKQLDESGKKRMRKSLTQATW